ncbi:MAG: hypothetical protein HEP70_20330 [Rhodobiaceae bacterium]|jgi:hypothetical protein|nr:hypothetical protein [Rhodobiaceae bacterium]
MPRFIFAVALTLFAFPAFAQSWTHSADRAVAPPATAGDPSSGFEIVCFQGEWILYPFGLPTAEGSAATTTIDDDAFPVQIIFGNGSDGIALDSAILKALKAGSAVRISSTEPSSRFDSTFGLRGSSRALNAVEEGCAVPTPATKPERFASAPQGSTSEAITLASALLRPVLTDAQRIDPKVGIETANIIDLGNGWQFLIADVGPSIALYGADAVATVLSAKSPSKDWQIVAQQTGVAVYIDSQGTSTGYPDIWYQSLRGANPPYAQWQWNGSQYEFSRTVPN